MRDTYNRRPQYFKRRIIARVTTTRKDLFLEESRWLHFIKPDELGKRYFNLSRTAGGPEAGYKRGPPSEEVRKKLGRPRTEEERRAQSERQRGKPHGTLDENGRKYKKRSDTGKKRKPYVIVISQKGRKHTEEQIEKNRLSHLDIPQSLETRQKRSESLKAAIQRKKEAGERWPQNGWRHPEDSQRNHQKDLRTRNGIQTQIPIS